MDTVKTKYLPKEQRYITIRCTCGNKYNVLRGQPAHCPVCDNYWNLSPKPVSQEEQAANLKKLYSNDKQERSDVYE